LQNGVTDLLYALEVREEAEEDEDDI
jgi:hypothetical protein